MNTYIITLTDTATYAIRSSSRERAEDLATEWFSEREPDCEVKIDNNVKPDITI